MKSRMVSFYIDLDALPPLMAAVEDFWPESHSRS